MKKTMVYRGHLSRCSHPMNPSQTIDAGTEVEVPKGLELCPLWEEVKRKTKASVKDGDG